MSRPELVTTGTSCKIKVPSGWLTTITCVSHRTCNRLIVVKYESAGHRRTANMVNPFRMPNEIMRDFFTGDVTLGIVPQELPQTISLDVYSSGTEGTPLQEDQYRSARAKVITIFLEDVAGVHGAPPFDDAAMITVTILKGPAQATPAPIETGTQGMVQGGKEAIQDFLDKITDPSIPGRNIWIPCDEIPPPYCPPLTPELAALPVGILGAGISGLYIAMMLDSLGIKYELLEGSSRTGGRLYMHNFPTNQGKYQYYDVGAMRYPDTSFMKRTFDLACNRLGLKDKMLPYIRDDDQYNTFLSYNGVTVTKALNQKTDKCQDIFNFSKSKGGQVPDADVALGSDYFWNVNLGNLRKLFVNHPFNVAFRKLKEFDDHTVTSYLRFVKKVPYATIKWYETRESRTGLGDEALTETVLASLVFNDPRLKDKKVDWYCFDGGSEILHKAMTNKIKSKPVHNHRAIIIKETDNGQSVTVTFDLSGAPQQLSVSQIEKKYSNVISTMSLACLRMVDLDKIYLSQGQLDAIRQLHYTPSIKIGLQFKTPWWEKLGIVGGQSSTDRPIRDVVYPSYGPDDSHAGYESWKKSNCMIASYNGMQDSQRIGGLMKGRGTPEEKVLLDLVMRDLAVLHNVDVSDLWKQYEDYHPWDFYRDQFQLGAFCQFGPGQFKNTYPYLTQPASKQQRLFFAGDATSTFHGWVAGALNSGWRTVLSLLQNHPELNPNPNEDIIAKFKTLWGPSEEWDSKDLAVLNYASQQLAALDTDRKSQKLNVPCG